MLALSMPWAVVMAAGVTGALSSPVLLTVLMRRQAKDSKQITAVNNAVNHVPEGSFTLIQRVSRIEQDTVVHREWVHGELTTVANQVGSSLPPRPEVKGNQ